jgi:hypothetical protein
MKKIIYILFAFALVSCSFNNKEKSSTDRSTPKDEINKTNFLEDRQQIEMLLKKMYEWTDSAPIIEQYPVSDEQDSIYLRLDSIKTLETVNALKNTNFFSEQFIDNWLKIADSIDKKLQTKEVEWIVGDISPFAIDANPWCNCQDTPDDDCWKNIKLNFLELDNHKAILTWTWGNTEWSKDFSYKIELEKKDEAWQVDYMQGFDIHNYFQ